MTESYWTSVAAAMVGEVVTEDEVERVTGEEFERLMDPETKIVKAAELEAAVDARLVRLVQEYFPILRQGEPE